MDQNKLRNTKRNITRLTSKKAKGNDVQSQIGRRRPKELIIYVKSIKERENSQVKFSSELSGDDFNNYFITACDQQKITPVSSKYVKEYEYQSETLSIIDLQKLK